MAILFNGAEQFEQFRLWNIPVELFQIHAQAKEEKSFEGFSIFSSGSHLVQWRGIV